jgi:hypothetical protein
MARYPAMKGYGIVSAGSYLVIRCSTCKTFTYVDRFQEWKLCPVCGTAIDVKRATRYLEVEEYGMAEAIVKQLERHLHATGKKDLTSDERRHLRTQYAEWIRQQA